MIFEMVDVAVPTVLFLRILNRIVVQQVRHSEKVRIEII